MDIGEVIKAARERRHPRMSQADLGALVGVHKNTVGKWETGKQSPIRHLVQLEAALGIRLTNRQPVPEQAQVEVSRMSYSELLNLQMRITGELARRGEGDARIGPSEAVGNGWSVTRRSDLPDRSGPAAPGEAL